MIVFNSVYRTFDPDESGLKDISFSIDPGELVMITGHSGSGKTTIMRLLTKEYTPNKGEIHFNNQELSKIGKNRLHEHRRQIGVVFQDYRLIPEMNVWENIALPLAITGKQQHEIEERVTDLLKLVQLPEKAHLFPSQLSGGEAQRISIARALANAPQVIFADEPTGNLDQDTSQSIAHLLKQINELGTTLIFATHDPKILAIFADKRHINLKNGTIEFDTGEDKKKTTKTKETLKKSTTDDVSAKKAESKQTDEPSKTEDTENKTVKVPESSNHKDKKASETEPSSKETATQETTEDSLKEKKESGGFLAKLFGKKKPQPSKDEEGSSEDSLKESADDKNLATEAEEVKKDSPEEKSKDELSTKNTEKKSNKKINEKSSPSRGTTKNKK